MERAAAILPHLKPPIFLDCLDGFPNFHEASVSDNPTLGLSWDLGSRKYGSIHFNAYSNDHPPRHVHGTHEEAVAIVDLLPDGNVALADRKDAIRPGNAKRSTVKKLLTAALAHYDDLVALWEEVNGEG